MPRQMKMAIAVSSLELRRCAEEVRSIMYEGIKMLKECKFDDRTMIIVSLSFSIGVGLTQTSGNFFAAFPSAVGDVFNGNAVAGVFVVSLLLSLFLPKKTKVE